MKKVGCFAQVDGRLAGEFGKCFVGKLSGGCPYIRHDSYVRTLAYLSDALATNYHRRCDICCPAAIQSPFIFYPPFPLFPAPASFSFPSLYSRVIIACF